MASGDYLDFIVKETNKNVSKRKLEGEELNYFLLKSSKRLVRMRNGERLFDVVGKRNMVGIKSKRHLLPSEISQNFNEESLNMLKQILEKQYYKKEKEQSTDYEFLLPDDHPNKHLTVQSIENNDLIKSFENIDNLFHYMSEKEFDPRQEFFKERDLENFFKLKYQLISQYLEDDIDEHQRQILIQKRKEEDRLTKLKMKEYLSNIKAKTGNQTQNKASSLAKASSEWKKGLINSVKNKKFNQIFSKKGTFEYYILQRMHRIEEEITEKIIDETLKEKELKAIREEDEKLINKKNFKETKNFIPGVNCEIRSNFVDPRSVKIAKNLDQYIKSRVKTDKIIIPNTKKRKEMQISDLSPTLISKISDDPHQQYKKRVLETKPQEVREILNITKVPFMNGTIPDSRVKRRTSLESRRLKTFVDPAVKINRIKKNNSVILEELELDKIHGEILSQNISKGIAKVEKRSDRFSFLPSLQSNADESTIHSHKGRIIRKSSSIPSFSINDFKKAYQFMKAQKSFKPKFKRTQRRSVINLENKHVIKTLGRNSVIPSSMKNFRNISVNSCYNNFERGNQGPTFTPNMSSIGQTSTHMN
ncbi:unnamed protein product [Moneuplotes crassus]|uniref:Uncharacterized protein n=1 Tax=Euplotes crassus TaxID=5936 RepID=A0AAD1U3J0_EUPCR|nr:unnamed protein product [Moneuplotes crassus]